MGKYYIRGSMYYVITQPCPNFNGGLDKPPWSMDE